MTFVKQLAVILAASLAGELLSQLLPLPIPAGIYGLALLFGLLCLGWVKLPQVEQTGQLLLELLPLFLVPATVGLMSVVGELRAMLPAFLTLTLAGTLLVMGVSGWVTQWLLGRKKP